MPEGLMLNERTQFGNYKLASDRVTELNLKEASGEDFAKQLNTSTFAALENAIVEQTGADRPSVEVGVSQAVEEIFSAVGYVFDVAKKENPKNPRLLRRDVSRNRRGPQAVQTEKVFSISNDDPPLSIEEMALGLQYFALRLVEPQPPLMPDRDDGHSLGVKDSSPTTDSGMMKIYEANKQTFVYGMNNGLKGGERGKLGDRIRAMEAIIDGMIAGPASDYEVVLDEVEKPELIEMSGSGNYPNAVKPKAIALIDRRLFHTVSYYLQYLPLEYRESQEAISSLQRVMGVKKPDYYQHSKR